MNAVMKVVKDLSLPQRAQDFGERCRLEVRVRLGAEEDFCARMSEIEGCRICKV